LVPKSVDNRLLVELLDRYVRTKGGDVGKNLGLTRWNQNERSGKTFRMELFCFLAEKGLQWC
jgi:hypothetical protein